MDNERYIYRGLEEPSYLLAWTATEVGVAMVIWGFCATVIDQYTLGSVLAISLLVALLLKRTDFSSRCQLQHQLHRFGLWLGKSSLVGNTHPFVSSQAKAEEYQLQSIPKFPKSDQVEFLS